MQARSTRPAYTARLDETDWSTPAQLQDLSFLCDDDSDGALRGPALPGASRKERIVDCRLTWLRVLARKSTRFFARFAPAPRHPRRWDDHDRAIVE